MKSFLTHPLTAEDLQSLDARGIDAATAQAQRIERVADLEGRAAIGASGRPGIFSGRYCGIALAGNPRTDSEP